MGYAIAYINYPGSLGKKTGLFDLHPLEDYQTVFLWGSWWLMKANNYVDPGFGQKWVEELPKRLGIADVDSCKLALDHLLSIDVIKDLEVGNRVFVSGGSHGGFITAHLTSRYPEVFLAACMRNPVVDLVGTASGGSDIPDW
jgi:acylaminoacyl-peptidase